MSFQAYLDNVEEKTGKTPNDFIAEAKKKNITEFKDIIAWLKKDYELDTGHRVPSPMSSVMARSLRCGRLLDLTAILQAR